MPEGLRAPGAAREVAERAARQAGALLLSKPRELLQVRHKGLVDLVTDADLACEELVRDAILSTFPTHTILGEEGGHVGGSDARFRWIVDPLDGTTNYAHGFPVYCVSIALEALGELVLGVVYDPTRDEMFAAEIGQGATLNGQPIHVSPQSELISSLLATGFPYDREAVPRAMRAFDLLSRESQAVRRAGSAALDLCYVACGRLEGYWEYVVRPWDMAAGVLLVREAGGKVSRVDGSAWHVACENVLSSNAHIHDILTASLAGLPNSTDTTPGLGR